MQTWFPDKLGDFDINKIIKIPLLLCYNIISCFYKNIFLDRDVICLQKTGLVSDL